MIRLTKKIEFDGKKINTVEQHLMKQALNWCTKCVPENKSLKLTDGVEQYLKHQETLLGSL